MGKRVYFVSDSHLGAKGRVSSRERERLLVNWLDRVKKDAAAIYLLGDIFDFWFDYSTVVPRGYVRLLGKIAGICDSGIPVHYFPGNHDMWAFGYFESELGVKLQKGPLSTTIMGKRFHLGHGDGLGPGDRGYKLLKSIFACRFCQFLFAALHPGIGVRLALRLSKTSRAANDSREEEFLGNDREWLIQYCKKHLEKEKVDYFVFGHRHLPIDAEVLPGVRYVNTGDWFRHFSYAVFDGSEIRLEYFEEKSG